MLRIVTHLVFVCSLVIGVSACNTDSYFAEPVVLGGEKIDAATLNYGYEQYMRNCYACHGENGDGKGPASAYLRPAPRDFRTGVFKFGGVRNPGLPHTDDLVDMVSRGLSGTAMLPWDLSKEQLRSIINYIKTFSSVYVADSAQRWSKEAKLGERIVPTEDPWKGRAEEAIEHGKVVYHINAQCRTCHPSYITQQEMWDLSQKVGWGYAELKYRSELKASDAFAGTKILPIDFTFHRIKTLNPSDSDEEQRSRLYRVIGAGIPGAAMPTWKDAISEEDLWGLTYYIQSLAKMRDTPKIRELRASLANQVPFVVPGTEADESQASDAEASPDEPNPTDG
ncbi:MAG: cytochrome c [Myxococcota bacterium]